MQVPVPQLAYRDALDLELIAAGGHCGVQNF